MAQWVKHAPQLVKEVRGIINSGRWQSLQQSILQSPGAEDATYYLWGFPY
jgi:hypothetical protein